MLNHSQGLGFFFGRRVDLSRALVVSSDVHGDVYSSPNSQAVALLTTVHLSLRMKLVEP